MRAIKRRVIDHIAWVLEVIDHIIQIELGYLSLMYSATTSFLLVIDEGLTERRGSALIHFPIFITKVRASILS